jgi:hypothetical protein
MRKKVGMPPVETPEAVDVETPSSEARAGFEAFCETIPADATLSVQLYRLPSEYNPRVMRREKLPPVMFAAEQDQMEEDVRRRYGPGLYQLYIRYTDPKTRARRMVCPQFLLAPGAEDEGQTINERRQNDGRASLEESPVLDDTSAMIDRSMARLAQAADVQARAIQLRALTNVVSGPSEATSNPIEQTKAAMELFGNVMAAVKSLQPPPAPAGDPANIVSLVDKLGDLMVKFGGGGGGDMRDRAGGWDFAVEALRQLGPNLPAVLDVATKILERLPGGAMVTPVPHAPIPGPGEIPPMEQRAVNPPPISVSWTDVLAAVGNDDAAARRLALVLDMAFLEYSRPRGEWSEGYERLLDVIETHTPGLASQFASVTAEKVWELIMLWDPRTAYSTTAPEWVREFVAFLKNPPTDDGGKGP